MSAAASAAVDPNRLLAALTACDLGLLDPHLESIALETRRVLEAPNRPIRHVYFMQRGIASVVAVNDDDKQVEIGIVGCEGMTGMTVVMGDDRSPHATYIQVAGHGRRIAAGKLRQALEKSSSLHQSLLKFAHAFMIQTAHTAIANGRASLEERLARWILMAHDRVPSDTLPLTHEFLSIMLGVRRAGVTVALHGLEGRGLIKSRRGLIRLIDREGVRAVAGGYYGTPEAELKRLMR
jgi:CRP-like cAMP-binding protein